MALYDVQSFVDLNQCCDFLDISKIYSAIPSFRLALLLLYVTGILRT